MKLTPMHWLVGGGITLAVLAYLTRDQVSAVSAGVEDVQAAVVGWKSVGQGSQWVPVLNAAEQQYGIPADLLARIAYQETHFRPEYIDGSKASSAGALGLMQLLGGTSAKGVPWFTSVNVPVPFTSADTNAQIQQGAQLLVGLMNHFNDWTLAVAAYNDGQGNIDKYVAGARALPAETSSYVADILADVAVPVSGGGVPA